MKLKDVRKYLLEENMEIRITPKYINVVNYESIGHFDTTRVIIYYDGGNVLITGTSLSVSKLMNKEILIFGNINNIELR